MEAILVIDVDDDIDIENTQATYIELQCNNHTTQMSLINHWLKPLPEKQLDWNDDDEYVLGYNDCIDEILGCNDE